MELKQRKGEPEMNENQIVRLISNEIEKKVKECMSLNNRNSAEFISAYSSMLALNEILFKINITDMNERITPPIKIEYEQSD